MSGTPLCNEWEAACNGLKSAGNLFNVRLVNQFKLLRKLERRLDELESRMDEITDVKYPSGGPGG